MNEPKKTTLSLGLVHSQSQRQCLREEQRILWNKRNSDSLAYVPSELRATLSPEEATEANERFVRGPMAHLETEFRDTSEEVRRDRLQNQKLVLEVGYGKGFGSKYVAKAAEAGLSTVVVDVSDVACDAASKDLCEQFVAAPQKGVAEPAVIEGDILDVLSGTSDLTINLEQVEVIYLCRVLGILREEDAPEFLRCLGKILSPTYDKLGRNRVVLAAAFRNDNPTRVGCTSKLYTREMVLSHIEEGAGRKIFVSRETPQDYFDQKYLVVTLMAEALGEEK